MRLHLHDKLIEISSLKEVRQDADIPGFSDFSEYFRGVLSFCRAWVNGQQGFTIHTSGSTGVPKPITVSRRQMEASARMTVSTLGLKTGDTALVCLNTAYIAGQMMLVRGLEAGMDLVVVSPSSLPFAQIPEDISIDFTALVPLQVQTMLEAGDVTALTRLNRLKALLVGGAPVSYALQQAIRAHIASPVYSTYGMTETVSHIALKRLNGPGQSEEYKVLDDVEIGIDQRGCLTIRGAVTDYRKLVTNDLVHIKDDRHFEWIGRADLVINSGGVKIFPEKVEAVMAKWMYEKKIGTHFFVGALPDNRLGEKVVLVIEGSPQMPALEKELLAFLSQQLSAYEMPKEIHYVPVFAMTSTGKVQRKQTLRFK